MKYLIVVMLLGLVTSGGMLIQERRKLNKAEKKLEQLQNNAYYMKYIRKQIVLDDRSILIVIDNNNCLVFVSENAQQCFSELQTMEKNMPAPESIAVLFDKNEETYKHDDRIYEIVSKIVCNPDGSKAGRFLFLVDITEQQNLLEYTRELKWQLDQTIAFRDQFYKNMSHEFRTPMNVISGMTEMLKSEQLLPLQKKYLKSIDQASAYMMGMIDDLLSYDRLQGEDPVLFYEEYNLNELLEEVINQTMLELANKDVEFYMNVNPLVPTVLYGEQSKIRLMISQIMENAIKFTQKGSITMDVNCIRKEQQDLLLVITISDTGIGMSKEQVERVFDRFYKVDTKKALYNRGIGMGLPIAKRLCELLGGTIRVSSTEYMGSSFELSIPQKIVEESLISFTAMEQKYRVITICDAEFLESVRKLCRFFLCKMYSLEMAEMSNDQIDFIIMDYKHYRIKKDEILQKYVGKIPIFVLFNPHKDEVPADGFIAVEKPLYPLKFEQMIVNSHDYGKVQSDQRKFIIPDARILIVDDNVINQEVSEVMLESTRARIDKASQGEEAIHMIQENEYDLVFMDNIMPVMKGEEAIRIIRGLSGNYSQVPIVALTADVTDGSKERLLRAGANDFLSKPVSSKKMMAEILKYVDSSKICYLSQQDYCKKNESSDAKKEEGKEETGRKTEEKPCVNGENESTEPKKESQKSTEINQEENAPQTVNEAKTATHCETVSLKEEGKDSKTESIGSNQSRSDEQSTNSNTKPTIRGIDIAAGIENCGSKELFYQLLGDYYKVIDLKTEKIKEHLEKGRIHEYVVEVHALKSASRMIGALPLSNLFLKMEKMGNANNIEILEKETPNVLKLYQSYKNVLKKYGTVQNESNDTISTEKMVKVLERMKEAFDSFDLDGVDTGMKELEQYAIPDNVKDDFELLRAYVADVAIEDAMELIQKMIDKLLIQ